MNTALDLLLAVPEAMTDAERLAFLHRWGHVNPHQVGAHIPDVLDLLDSSDAHLAVTEPLMEAHLADVPANLSGLGPDAEGTAPVPTSLSGRALNLAAYVVLYSYGLRTPAPCDSCGGSGSQPAVPVLNRPGGPCDACGGTGTNQNAPAAPWLLVQDFLDRLSRYVAAHP